jgi:replicative DNA helicase
MSNPEQMLISSVINAKDHMTPASNGINSKFFHSYPDEWQWIERYIRKHRRAPSKSALRSKFPGFKIQSGDDVAHWCDEVRLSHATAETSSAIEEILEDIEDGHIEDAVKKMQSRSLSIESALSGENHDSDIITNYQDVIDEVMRRHARASEFGQSGIPTGFPTLDERTGGPQPGQVWIVGARLGQGKTWSLARMACAAAFSGFNIQYDALEGTRAEIAMRIHTFASSEYGQKVFKNIDLVKGQNFSPREYKEFLQDLRNDVKGRMHIADTTKGPISPLSIAAQIERNKVDAVYLDYITLMDHADSSGDDWKSIGRLSAGLKRTAVAYQVPIIAAAQLNRTAAAGKDLAGPEALAESDAIGRDADAVVTMRQLSKHVIAAKLAKFRHGRDGYTWYCKFLPNTGHFEEITFDEAQDVIADDKDEELEDDFSFKPRKKGSFKEASEKRHVTVKKKTKDGGEYTVTDKRSKSKPKKKATVKSTKASGGASKSTAKKRVVKKGR